MNKFAVISVLAVAGSAFAGSVASINSVAVTPRIFNDRPDSTLAITNNFPSSVQIAESNFGPGGFANRHSAYFSNDGGASAFDFNYEDGFAITVTVNRVSSTNVAVEAGIHSDLFGFGYFGQLPNGEIAAFGSIFPFHSFGVVPGINPITLRMLHFPGGGNGVDPLPLGAQASAFEYQYSSDGGLTWVSSGLKPLGGTEGGIPSNFPFFIGFGAQHNAAAEEGAVADTIFSNISVVPTPGAAALLGLAGLAGLRRRRA